MSARFQRFFESALVALFLWLVPFCATAADITFETSPLTIVTSGGQIHKFTVELAVDNDQRSRGLMDRRHMPRDRGMLFDFGQTREVMMWMKNTYLPLDMLFINKEGKVETIHENAVPLSEAIIDSRVPVAFVLELNGGTVRRLGIAVGDIVDNQRISAATP